VGNSPLVDYRYALSGSQYDPVDLGAYLPGVSQTDRTTDTTHYLHNDHLGSTWYMSGDDLTTMYRRAVRTGFGQHVVGTGSGPDSRYGYAGSWGYQEHDVDADGAGDGQPDNRLNASYATGFPYLHVGARYYDPGSGRFMQRDPIGIRGGLNVYEYAYSAPTQAVDPSGLVSVGVGIEVGGHAMLFGGSIEIGVHVTWPPSIGIIVGGGGVMGPGLGGGISGTLTCSTANHVDELLGPSVNAGAWGGAGPIGGGSVFQGVGGGTPVIGVKGTAGIGVGAGGGVGMGGAAGGSGWVSGLIDAWGKSMGDDDIVWVCFVSGTFVLTSDGLVAIENLEHMAKLPTSDPMACYSTSGNVIDQFARQAYTNCPRSILVTRLCAALLRIHSDDGPRMDSSRKSDS
jgi:RHS repeat-associated protein